MYTIQHNAQPRIVLVLQAHVPNDEVSDGAMSRRIDL